METIHTNFEHARKTPSDINQHLDTLKKLSAECGSVLECGTRDVVSSWAFLLGLTESQSSTKSLTCSDLYRSNGIDVLEKCCSQVGFEFNFIEGNDLTSKLPPSDLIFIDTWHVYGQLKRELARFGPMASKFIVMHDTTVDAIYGETIREKMDLEKQIQESGFPREEILRGLWPAVEEFLETHPEWVLQNRYTHNNGLTVLRRVKSDLDFSNEAALPEVSKGPEGSFIESLGKGTYGIEHITVLNESGPARIHIGAFCSISAEIKIFLDDNHRTDWVTTFPFGPTGQDRWGQQKVSSHTSTNGDVRIGNDVWIGRGVTIMSGVTVGDGAVLSVGAVVATDVAPYSIVAGNPAQHTKFRFRLDQIQALQRIQWWLWSDEKIRDLLPNLCNANIDDFIEKFDSSAKNTSN